MMLPIPRAGMLREVDGQDAARAVPGDRRPRDHDPARPPGGAAARGRPLPRLPVRARRHARRRRGVAPRGARGARHRHRRRRPSLEPCRSSSSPRTSSATSRGASGARRRTSRRVGHDVRALDVSVEPWDPDARRVGRRGRVLGADAHRDPAGARPRPGASTDRCGRSGSTPTQCADFADPGGLGRRRVAVPRSRAARRSTATPRARDRRRASALVGAVVASHGCAHRCRHCPVPVVLRRARPPRRRGRGARRHRAARRRRRTTHHVRRPRLPQRASALAPHRRRDARALPRRHLRLHGEGRARPAPRRRCGPSSPTPAACSSSRRSSRSTTRCSHASTRATPRPTPPRAVGVLRAAGIEVRPSWLPFTPWTTRDDLIALLDFVYDHDLVGSVDPVQYTSGSCSPRVAAARPSRPRAAPRHVERRDAPPTSGNRPIPRWTSSSTGWPPSSSATATRSSSTHRCARRWARPGRPLGRHDRSPPPHRELVLLRRTHRTPTPPHRHEHRVTPAPLLAPQAGLTALAEVSPRAAR